MCKTVSKLSRFMTLLNVTFVLLFKVTFVLLFNPLINTRKRNVNQNLTNNSSSNIFQIFFNIIFKSITGPEDNGQGNLEA